MRKHGLARVVNIVSRAAVVVGPLVGLVGFAEMVLGRYGLGIPPAAWIGTGFIVFVSGGLSIIYSQSQDIERLTKRLFDRETPQQYVNELRYLVLFGETLFGEQNPSDVEEWNSRLEEWIKRVEERLAAHSPSDAYEFLSIGSKLARIRYSHATPVGFGHTIDHNAKLNGLAATLQNLRNIITRYDTQLIELSRT